MLNVKLARYGRGMEIVDVQMTFIAKLFDNKRRSKTTSYLHQEWCPFASVQHYNRHITEARTLITSGLILAHTVMILCFIFCGIVGFSWYAYSRLPYNTVNMLHAV